MGREIKPGDRFTRWTVMSEVRKGGKRYLHCKCDCGKEADVYYRSLLTGQSMSCGCLRLEKQRESAEDLTGRVYGKLKVLGRDGDKWLCRCECGNLTRVVRRSLVTGQTQSCGCIQRYIASSTGTKTIERNSAAQIARNKEWKTNFQVIGTAELPRNNTSGHKGVNWDQKRSRWCAYINVQKTRIFLGRFEKYEDAVAAREDAEEQYFKPLIEAAEKEGKK